MTALGSRLTATQHELLAHGARALKEQLIDRDGCECVWCERELEVDAATICKILPGPDYKYLLDNLFLTCEDCYQLRGGTTRGVGLWSHRCIASGLAPRVGIIERGLLAMIEQCRGKHVVGQLKEQLRELRSPEAPGPSIRARRIKRMLARAGHQCVWCSRSLHMGDVYLSVEHLIPSGNGGRNIEANLLPACTPCNHQRGSNSITTWIDHCIKQGMAVRLGAIEMSLRRQCRVASAAARATCELEGFHHLYGQHLDDDQLAEIDLATCIPKSNLAKSIFFSDGNFGIGYTREHTVLLSHWTPVKAREAVFDAERFFACVLAPESSQIHVIGSNQHSLTVCHDQAGISFTFTDWRTGMHAYLQHFATNTADKELLVKWCQKYQTRLFKAARAVQKLQTSRQISI